MTSGMTLKVERIKHNLTQKQLKELSGVSMVTIGKIERGDVEKVTLVTYKKLAKALDIPVEELIKEEEV
ncbi:helix-turn-helix domain-containing protein [Peptacetobacter sp. AB800]|uniref:helix-turn-helix domain-containing protein n=1 Tax=Peptacetobacter sp. AB800 TaxID=3388428 RepID=UPI0039FD0B48